MTRIFIFILTVYVLVVLLVYLGQRSLQYHPDRNLPGTPAASGVPEFQEINVRTEDGLDLLAWFAPPKKKDGQVIVFYHGNAGNIAGRATKAREWLDAGYGVYMCEYRGFGGNPGSISEEGFYKDARSALTWLASNGYSPMRWIIYGESIGSGAAVEMAKEYQPPVLVLEAPFSSILDVARQTYFWLPVSYMLKDKFDNISKIQSVHSRLLIIHGDADPTIPLTLSKKLFDVANHIKQMVTIEGGHHNDLYDHHAGHIILEWLGRQGL